MCPAQKFWPHKVIMSDFKVMLFVIFFTIARKNILMWRLPYKPVNTVFPINLYSNTVDDKYGKEDEHVYQRICDIPAMKVMLMMMVMMSRMVVMVNEPLAIG